MKKRQKLHQLTTSLVGVGALLACEVSSAQTINQTAPRPRAVANPMAGGVILSAGQAKTIASTAKAKKVFIANPETADIDASDPQNIIVYGRKLGTTSLIIERNDDTRDTITVKVGRPLRAIATQIQRKVPSSAIEVQETPTGLRLSGSVQTPEDAAAIKAIAQGYLTNDDTLTFDARIVNELQVLLQVRVAEVAKTARNFLGFNWSATGLAGNAQIGFASGRFGSETGNLLASTTGFGALGVNYTSASGVTNINAVLDALKEQNLVSVLAEPNLTAISGSRASFVAGGEFPVPVVQGRADFGNTTVQWKEFGIKVDFTPTVINNERINIKVYSEVSELSQIGAVTVNGISIPSLTVRKVDTSVDLASGQSFAIAGLFKNNATSTTRGVPFLSDIPVLGALFRSRAFLRDESELVIMITPYVVTPVTNSQRLRLPTDNLRFGNELEQLLLGRVERPSSRKTPVHLVGPSGFMLDETP